MSDERLTDPVLGTLRPCGECGWYGRVWLTPKHEVEVAFEPFSLRRSDDETRQELARAGRVYLHVVRSREWEHRLETARRLTQQYGREQAGEVEGEALARLLRLVQIRLFHEGESALVYHGPPPWDNCDVDFAIFEDGSIDGVDVFPMNDYPTLQSG